MERSKGVRGENEAAGIFRAHGLPVDRTVQNSGFYLRGDLTGLDGYFLSVKRQEVLRLPQWTREAESEAGDAVPIVCYRSNGEPWRASLSLDALAGLIAAARGNE
mgnify:CR=1 FL=1